MDRSKHDEQLRINFNISFPALSCEFATLDVSDALGLVSLSLKGKTSFPFRHVFKHAPTTEACLQKKLNLTRTVRKLPIDENLERAGHYIHDDRQLDIKYDDHPEASLSIPLPLAGLQTLVPVLNSVRLSMHCLFQEPLVVEDYSKSLDSNTFTEVLNRYPIGAHSPHLQQHAKGVGIQSRMGDIR